MATKKSKAKVKGNPFREGTTKAKCYDLFKKIGATAERADVLTRFGRLGAAETTAASWYQLFKGVR